MATARGRKFCKSLPPSSDKFLDPLLCSCSCKSVCFDVRLFLCIVGVPFYSQVGSLVLGKVDGEYTNNIKTLAVELGEEISVLDSEHLKQQFPYIGNCETLEGVYSPRNAGHISPRNFIKAQQLLAKRNGCDIINDLVKTVSPIGSGDFEIEVESSGNVITGKKILLTTGSFIHSRNLLPYDKQLKLDLYGITVLLVSLS